MINKIKKNCQNLIDIIQPIDKKIKNYIILVFISANMNKPIIMPHNINIFTHDIKNLRILPGDLRYTPDYPNIAFYSLFNNKYYTLSYAFRNMPDPKCINDIDCQNNYYTSDCGETTLLNLFNYLLYKDGKLNYEWLPDNCMQEIKDFYKKNTTIESTLKDRLKFNYIMQRNTFILQKLDYYDTVNYKVYSELRDVDSYNIFKNPINLKYDEALNKDIYDSNGNILPNEKEIIYSGYTIRPGYITMVRILNKLLGYHNIDPKYNENLIFSNINNYSLIELLLTFKNPKINDILKHDINDKEEEKVKINDNIYGQVVEVVIPNINMTLTLNYNHSYIIFNNKSSDIEEPGNTISNNTIDICKLYDLYNTLNLNNIIENNIDYYLFLNTNIFNEYYKNFIKELPIYINIIKDINDINKLKLIIDYNMFINNDSTINLKNIDKSFYTISENQLDIFLQIIDNKNIIFNYNKFLNFDDINFNKILNKINFNIDNNIIIFNSLLQNYDNNRLIDPKLNSIKSLPNFKSLWFIYDYIKHNENILFNINYKNDKLISEYFNNDILLKKLANTPNNKGEYSYERYINKLSELTDLDYDKMYNYFNNINSDKYLNYIPDIMQLYIIILKLINSNKLKYTCIFLILLMILNIKDNNVKYKLAILFNNKHNYNINNIIKTIKEYEKFKDIKINIDKFIITEEPYNSFFKNYYYNLDLINVDNLNIIGDDFFKSNSDYDTDSFVDSDSYDNYDVKLNPDESIMTDYKYKEKISEIINKTNDTFNLLFNSTIPYEIFKLIDFNKLFNNIINIDIFLNTSSNKSLFKLKDYKYINITETTLIEYFFNIYFNQYKSNKIKGTNTVLLEKMSLILPLFGKYDIYFNIMNINMIIIK